MKSRITIEVDFDNGQPYIKCLNYTDSDDVRDKLLSFFRQKFGGTSSWCKIEFGQFYSDQSTTFFIRPIAPNQLSEESKIMSEQGRLNEDNPIKAAVTH
jgi:hypothetical protein